MIKDESLGFAVVVVIDSEAGPNLLQALHLTRRAGSVDDQAHHGTAEPFLAAGLRRVSPQTH